MNLLKFKLSRFLILLSLICFSWVGYLVWLRYTPTSLSFDFPFAPITQINPSDSTPKFSLLMPELSLNLPVTSAEVSKNLWPVSNSSLIHVSSSPLPGDPGNSVIYGHNWPTLLGNLKYAQIGQIIDVKTPNGAKKFTIDKVSVVSPDQTNLLNPTSIPTLTLYTCTGFLDSRRLVITASLL